MAVQSEPVSEAEAGDTNDEKFPRRTSWHEALGVHPDDDRDEIVVALEREARDGETWYDAIGVSSDASRREIVEALRREFDRVEDAIDQQIGRMVRERYGWPGPPRG